MTKISWLPQMEAHHFKTHRKFWEQINRLLLFQRLGVAQVHIRFWW